MLNSMFRNERSEILNLQRIMILAMQISKSGLSYVRQEKQRVSLKMKSPES